MVYSLVSVYIYYHSTLHLHPGLGFRTFSRMLSVSIPSGNITHYSWVERGTVQVNILPKDVIPHETVGITGDQTPDPWIMSPTTYQLSHMRPLKS